MKNILKILKFKTDFMSLAEKFVLRDSPGLNI